METVHWFRSIRVRTVYLIPLYSTGSPLRAVVLLRRSRRQILSRIVEVCLFKIALSNSKGPMTWKGASPLQGTGERPGFTSADFTIRSQ